MDSVSRNITWGFVGVTGLIVLYLGSQIFEVNHAGYVQVKQSAIEGKMSVVSTPGMYPRMFAQVHEYKISDVYDFTDKEDQISVRFGDAATATISGQIKYRLPMDEPKILQIHQDFRSDENLHSQLIRLVVASALKQSATLFGAEEVYSTRRADFINLVNEQIRNGIYATTYNEEQAKDENGDVQVKRHVAVKVDVKGNPVIEEQSTFQRYNIELVQLVINDITFDEKTQELIAERKKADQQKIVARANADKAKQDALTAEAEGRAKVAVAQAEANVKKETAVVAAQQETEVAHQKALQAEQNKLAIIATGEAEAQAAALKVKAGLSPLERANIQKETAIGVAHELASIKLPAMMVLGGGEKGALNPFDAVGLQSFINISKNISEAEKGAINDQSSN